MKVVVGLVGEKGAGKETVANLLKEICAPYSFEHVRFTDLLKETLTLWSLPHTRANLQKIAVVMDEGFGVGTLAKAMEERLKNVSADVVVLESIRWDSDVELLRSLPNSVLIYITANTRTRYERTRARAEKVGENNATFEQFVIEEQAPNEIHIARIGSTADIRIANDSSIEEVRTSIVHAYDSLIRPRLG